MAEQIRSLLKKEISANVGIIRLMENKSLHELGAIIAAKSATAFYS